MSIEMKRRTVLASIGAVGLSACAGAQSVPFSETLKEGKAPTIDFVEVNSFTARANAAYSTEAEIRAKFPRTVRVATPEGAKVQYFLERNDRTKVQWISIRGTANFNDILHDIGIHVEEHNSVPIPLHKGFRDIARLVYADVKPHLNKRYRTRLTGHSLGAAVAAIVMLYLERDGYIVDKVINFGQPKFTTAAGQDHYKHLPLYRVIDKNDLVPMLPPSGLGFSRHGPYVHIGAEAILLDGTEYVYLTDHDSSRLSVGVFWRSKKFASLDDHHVSNYVSRVSDKLKRADSIRYYDWLKTLEAAGG